MSAIAAPSLWRPPGIASPRSCPHRHRRPRWRRWLELFSAVSGDEILDDNGNVVLDASGNAVTSDGAGDATYCLECNVCARGTVKPHCALEIAPGTAFYGDCYEALGDPNCMSYGITATKINGGISGTYDLTWNGCLYSYSAPNTSCSEVSYNTPGCTGGINSTTNSSSLVLSLNLTSAGASLVGGYVFAGIGLRVIFANALVSLTPGWDCSQPLSFSNNRFKCGNSYIITGIGQFEVVAKNAGIATATFS